VKPILLEIDAFGPYADRQRLDFRELGEERLFAITGPTGSGKSAILDAIGFALYGETSGGLREPKEMRSHHAPRETPTRVLFEFALGSDRYRIERIPEQSRPKRRGGGETNEPASAHLWKRKEGEDETKEGELLARKPGEVDEKVIELLGFEAEQFRQVVVLPQGKIQELLLAKTAEREGILEVLFPSPEVRAIEEGLVARRKGLEGEMKEGTIRRSELLGRAGVETVEGFEIAIGREVAARDLAVILASRKREEAELAARDLAVALEASEKLDRLRKAREEMARVEAMRPTNETKKREVERAKSAQQVEPTRDEFLRCRKGEADAENDRKRMEALAAEAGEELRRLEERLAQVLPALRTEQEARTDEARSLQGRLPLVREVEKAEAGRESAAEEIVRARSAVAALGRQLEKQGEAVGETERVVEEARAAEAGLAGLRSLATEAKRVAGAAERLGAIEKEMGAKRKNLAADREALGEREAEWARAKEELDRVDRLWREGRAAELARALVAGAPCPVCGATEHPNPAAATGERIDDERLEAHRTRVERVTSLREVAREALRDAEEQERRDTLELDRLRGELGARADAGLEALELEKIETERSATRAEKLAAGREEAVEVAREAKGRLLVLQEEARRRAEAIVEIETKRKGAEENAARIRAELGPGLESASAVEARLEAIATRLRAIEQSKQALAEERSEAERTLADLRVRLEAKSSEAEKRQRDARNAESIFRGALEGAGFSSAEELETVRREKSALTALDEAIRAFDLAERTGVAELAKAEAEAMGLGTPDLEGARAHKAEAEARLDEANEGVGAARQKLTDLEETREKVRILSAAFAAREGEQRRVARLAAAASGDNEMKVAFSRWVLGARLDEVLELASKRLAATTRGRYELRRRLLPGDLRKKSGLDLEVFDDFTGQPRRVATLSGGEIFLASLALALATAEVVERRSGGRRLDTIFVDEGFGSLDSASLDTAIDSLFDLGASGRLVGVISHVPELAERLPARLEVAPSPKGSRARFVAGGGRNPIGRP
jgi:exonuclease SbcC